MVEEEEEEEVEEEEEEEGARNVKCFTHSQQSFGSHSHSEGWGKLSLTRS